jgi:hypothetical protein
MTQYSFSTIDPTTKDGTALAGDLNSWRDAVETNHGGNARPSYIKQYQTWLDTSVSTKTLLKYWDGVADITIGRFDETNDTFRAPQTRQEVVKTGSYTIDPADVFNAIIMNVTAGGTVTLPALATSKFEMYFVKNIAAAACVIDPNGGETIEGASTVSLAQNESMWIWPNAAKSSWSIAAYRIVVAAPGVPTGARIDMVGSTAPTGYLIEDGAAYSRTTYADLYNYLQAGFTAQGFTVTIATPAAFTKSAHGFTGGERVRLSTTGALPTGLNTSTDYYVTITDANTFRVSTTQANYEAGTYVASSGTQSGVHSFMQSLYGLGDGSTTFNVADRRSKFTIGNAAGRTVGTELPSTNKAHTHGVTDPTHNHGHSDPTHAHGVSDPTHSHTWSYNASGSGGTGFDNGANQSGPVNVSTTANGTGIAIAAAATGLANVAAATGISIQSQGAAEGYPRHLSALSCVKY